MSDPHEQLQRWWAGDLDEADAAEVQAWMREPDHARTALAQAHDERVLRQRLAGAPTNPDISTLIMRERQCRRRRRLLTATCIAAAALVVLGAGLLLVMPTSQDPVDATPPVLAVVESVSGAPQWSAPTLETRTLTLSSRLPVAARLALPPGAAVHLRLADGSALDLHAPLDLPATLRLGDTHSLHLRSGVLQVQAAARSAAPPLRVITPHAVCRVLGTRFLVRVDRRTQLNVQEGRVLWEPRLGATRTLSADESATATISGSRQELVVWDFGAGGTRLGGRLNRDAGGEAMDVVGEETLPQDAAGLLVRRDDYVRSTQPPAPPRPQLLGLLQQAEAVELRARVRFATSVPQNLSLATLFCQSAEDAARFLPLRWRGGEQPAGDQVFEIATVYTRDGRQLFLIDGVVVGDNAFAWPFARWNDHIQLMLHQHRGNEGRDLHIVYDRFSLSVY